MEREVCPNLIEETGPAGGGDPKGVGAAGYGLCMSTYDLSKIGLLCLNNGKYNRKQIVSEKWIKEMVKVIHTTDEQFRNMSYYGG